MSYSEAAERLNTTVEAVRLRALRGRWQKTIGNDKRPRIRLPYGCLNDGRASNERKPKNDGRTTVARTVDPALQHSAIEAHNATLKADVERLEAQLTEANARADKAIAALGALADEIAKLAEARSRPWWRSMIAG